MTKKSPAVLSPKLLGPALEEVALDHIEVNNQHVTSRWLKTDDAELFIWKDENGNIIKQQLSLFGQVVEWNIFDGVRSGLVIESDLDTESSKTSENVRFDHKPQRQSVQQAAEIISFAEVISPIDRQILIQNFATSVKASTLPLGERVRLFLRKLFS